MYWCFLSLPKKTAKVTRIHQENFKPKMKVGFFVGVFGTRCQRPASVGSNPTRWGPGSSDTMGVRNPYKWPYKYMGNWGETTLVIGVLSPHLKLVGAHLEWCVNTSGWGPHPGCKARHHQDDYILSKSRTKPSLSTVTGWGVDPINTYKYWVEPINTYKYCP